jgi:hypothetical protein
MFSDRPRALRVVRDISLNLRTKISLTTMTIYTVMLLTLTFVSKMKYLEYD